MESGDTGTCSGCVSEFKTEAPATFRVLQPTLASTVVTGGLLMKRVMVTLDNSSPLVEIAC
jgi:hypothetical protein